MNDNGILLTASALTALSPSARDEVLACLGIGAGEVVAPSPSSSDDGPPDFTVAMARKLIAQPINPKTLAVLTVIAQSPTHEFHLKDAIAAVAEARVSRDLSGVWSGITQRCRKILDDPIADFVWWGGEPIYDKSGEYIDQVGRVAPLTHKSLKAVFELN